MTHDSVEVWPATQVEVATHLFLSTTRVQELQKLGVLRKGQPLAEARAAYIDYLRERVAARAAAPRSSRARREHLLAEKAQAELDAMRSRLVSRVAVDATWRWFGAHVKAAMRCVPAAMPGLSTTARAGLALLIEEVLGDLDRDPMAPALGERPPSDVL